MDTLLLTYTSHLWLFTLMVAASSSGCVATRQRRWSSMRRVGGLHGMALGLGGKHI